MDTVLNCLVKEALVLKAKHACIAEVADIKFNDDFRMLCEQNLCGSYNRNWMCPPAVGSIGALKKRVLSFKQGLLVQTVYQLEDSFDWEGMEKGKVKHEKTFRKILESMRNNYTFPEILPLSAGRCMYCSKCAYLEGKKCYYPEKAVWSVEANGIDVMALVKDSGIPYNNGENTVSYVALILFKTQ